MQVRRDMLENIAMIVKIFTESNTILLELKIQKYITDNNLIYPKNIIVKYASTSVVSKHNTHTTEYSCMILYATI